MDLLLVSIILLPIVGSINPKLFENIPSVYPIFKSINKIIHIDNLKSLIYISDGKEVIEGSESSSVNTVYIKEKDIKGVENIEDDYDRMHLRNSLTKWKKGDFSNAVKVHNYVWEMLGGNIGKAEELDNDQINKIINKYY